jgi:hypothetical protein
VGLAVVAEGLEAAVEALVGLEGLEAAVEVREDLVVEDLVVDLIQPHSSKDLMLTWMAN